MVTHLHSTSYTSLLIIVKGDLALTPREITLHDLHESNLFSFKEADSIKALYTICQLWDLSHTCSQFKHKKMPLAIPLHRTQPACCFFPIFVQKILFFCHLFQFLRPKKSPCHFFVFLILLGLRYLYLIPSIFYFIHFSFTCFLFYKTVVFSTSSIIKSDLSLSIFLKS